jgi:hypothetical protein
MVDLWEDVYDTLLSKNAICKIMCMLQPQYELRNVNYTCETANIDFMEEFAQR